MFYMINLIFLWIAFNDANRRNYLMEKLSNSLEFDFHKKNSITVRLPTINFLDPRSLLTWLEARKVVLELGARFQKRVHIYTTYWLVITASLLFLLFAVINGYVDHTILSTQQWIVIGIHATFLTIVCTAILLPTSYVNK